MGAEAPLIGDAYIRKTSLPDFTHESEFLLRTVGKIAFDQLHGFFNAHGPVNREKQVNMVAHDHEIVDLEFSRERVEAKHVDEQLGHAICLE